MFRVVILGSGASLPTLQRGAAAVAVQVGGDLYLIDCGEGTQIQFRRARLRFGRLRAICISHLHGDHVNGLVGLLQTLSLGGRTERLRLVGPHGIAEYWQAIQRHQGVRLAYELDVEEIQEGTFLEASDHHIEAAPLDHGIATLGYAIVERDKPGRFDVEAATELGIEPGPEYGRLQRGESVTNAGGEIVRPEQVMGPPRAGRRIAYCVDTRPCEAAVRLGRGADLFLCDATFGEELRDEARKRGHCTARQAATMASRADARRLLLTHVSARYHDARPLLAEAREVFPETSLGEDLMEITI